MREPLPAIWAETAETNIPQTPQTSITYRDESLGATLIEKAWPFDEIVESKDFNQFLYLMSKIVKESEQKGIITWSNLITYDEKDWTRGSDGLVYQALQGSNLNQDPVSNPTFWVEINIGDTVIPDASEDDKGLIKLATEEMGLLGQDALAAVTSLVMQAKFDTIITVTSVGSNANGHWRKYSDGYIEQWGESPVLPNGDLVAIILPTNYVNADYNIQTSWAKTTESDSSRVLNTSSPTISQFDIQNRGGAATYTAYWSTKGY